MADRLATQSGTLRAIRSRGSLACHIVGVWLLAAPGQLLQHARLDSNRALLLAGIGADAHEGAGYRGHRPLQQLQLGLRTCHVGGVAALGSVPEDTGTLVSSDTLRPAPCCSP